MHNGMNVRQRLEAEFDKSSIGKIAPIVYNNTNSDYGFDSYSTTTDALSGKDDSETVNQQLLAVLNTATSPDNKIRDSEALMVYLRQGVAFNQKDIEWQWSHTRPCSLSCDSIFRFIFAKNKSGV